MDVSGNVMLAPTPYELLDLLMFLFIKVTLIKLLILIYQESHD
jgi:hypothetical protein